MKLSKSLLQALVVGLTLNGTATSCVVKVEDDDVKPCVIDIDGELKCGDEIKGKTEHDCPGCGMG